MVSKLRKVSRRRRVDLRWLSLSVLAVGGIELDDSRTGVAGGSGLIAARLVLVIGGLKESSSAPEGEALEVCA